MSLKHILNDDPPLHSPQPLSQAHNPPANGNGAPILVVAPQPPAPLSPSSRPSRDARSPSDVRNGDPAPPSREYHYQQQPPSHSNGPAPVQWEHHNGDRFQPDDTPSGPSSSYYAEQEESATPSPRISNGTSVGLSKEGSVEGNGRVLRKRKLPDDDEDYQPPGQKRVSSTVL